jgi:hypothetical protein
MIEYSVTPAFMVALFVTVTATLILGIFPGRTLALARAGAATYAVRNAGNSVATASASH